MLTNCVERRIIDAALLQAHDALSQLMADGCNYTDPLEEHADERLH